DEIAGWISSAIDQVNRKSETVLQEVANLPAKTAEVGFEERILGLVEGSEPMVIVPQNVSQEP
ncbi:MAG: hypothetical protein QF444_02580, partial [Phycisphaerales bacterium]|nr:hypothetical protein [Phycisphaerales bacterium]